MRYQSVIQYSISIPVTYLSVTVTSYMLPILTTPPESVTIVRANITFASTTVTSLPSIGSRSPDQGTQVARREFYDRGKKRSPTGIIRVPAELENCRRRSAALPCQVLFYVSSPNRDPPAIITAVMLRYSDTYQENFLFPALSNKIDLTKVYVT